MKIHEREFLVKEVVIKLNNHLLDVLMKSDLTEGEQLRVLNEVYGGMLASMAKYMIREERHGNTDTPGGLAPVEEDEEPEFDVEKFMKESEPPPPRKE